MPEVALLVGEGRVHRGVVEVEDLLAGIALVVLEHGVGDGMGDEGAVALRHVADALVEDLLEDDQRLLRVDLVVEGHHLELLPVDPARGVDLVHEVVEVLLPENAALAAPPDSGSM